MQTGLSHQGQQPNGFQGYSFTAGIRTSNNQQVEIFPQTDINGNCFFLINKWMAGLFQADSPFVIEDWFCGIHIHGKSCSCKNNIQLYHNI